MDTGSGAADLTSVLAAISEVVRTHGRRINCERIQSITSHCVKRKGRSSKLEMAFLCRQVARVGGYLKHRARPVLSFKSSMLESQHCYAKNQSSRRSFSLPHSSSFLIRPILLPHRYLGRSDEALHPGPSQLAGLHCQSLALIAAHDDLGMRYVAVGCTVV